VCRNAGSSCLGEVAAAINARDQSRTRFQARERKRTNINSRRAENDNKRRIIPPAGVATPLWCECEVEDSSSHGPVLSVSEWPNSQVLQLHLPLGASAFPFSAEQRNRARMNAILGLGLRIMSGERFCVLYRCSAYCRGICNPAGHVTSACQEQPPQAVC
jgi:hypothetical protein